MEKRMSSRFSDSDNSIKRRLGRFYNNRFLITFSFPYTPGPPLPPPYPQKIKLPKLNAEKKLKTTTCDVGLRVDCELWIVFRNFSKV